MRSSSMRSILAASVALVALHCTAAAKDEFVIGGVVALSGPYGVIGEAMRKGAELAAEMHGGKVLGAPITFHWEDSETKPQVAVQKGTRLIADGADLLFGEVSSGATIALMKLVERRKVPLLVTISASDEITGKDKNSYTFRTSNPVDMENRMMAEFAAQDGLKQIYGVVADYAVGREMWESLKNKLEAKGVAIVGEDFPALGNKDYSLIADKVAKSNADGVAMIMTGSDAITFLKQSGQIGLKDKKTVFGTMVMDELMGKAVGEQSYGVNSTLRYHFSHETPANQAFVAAFQERYGELPNQFAGEAFDGISWFLRIVDKSQTWDKEAWLEAFRNSTYTDSVEGTKKMRPCDNQAEQIGLFGKAVKGSGSLPPVTMEVTYTFEPAALFDPCD